MNILKRCLTIDNMHDDDLFLNYKMTPKQHNQCIMWFV